MQSCTRSGRGERARDKSYRAFLIVGDVEQRESAQHIITSAVEQYQRLFAGKAGASASLYVMLHARCMKRASCNPFAPAARLQRPTCKVVLFHHRPHTLHVLLQGLVSAATSTSVAFGSPGRRHHAQLCAFDFSTPGIRSSRISQCCIHGGHPCALNHLCVHRSCRCQMQHHCWRESKTRTALVHLASVFSLTACSISDKSPEHPVLTLSFARHLACQLTEVTHVMILMSAPMMWCAAAGAGCRHSTATQRAHT